MESSNDTYKTLFVGIADIKIGKAPQHIKTNLGSCVAICLYSPTHKLGGMLHFMLSSSKFDNAKATLKNAKYADTGIPELLKQLQKTFGHDNKTYVAKIFGGANVLTNVSSNIGLENIAVAKNILKAENIKIIAEKTGGKKGYRIDFNLETGKVICQIFGEGEEEY